MRQQGKSTSGRHQKMSRQEAGKLGAQARWHLGDFETSGSYRNTSRYRDSIYWEDKKNISNPEIVTHQGWNKAVDWDSEDDKDHRLSTREKKHPWYETSEWNDENEVNLEPGNYREMPMFRQNWRIGWDDEDHDQEEEYNLRYCDNEDFDQLGGDSSFRSERELYRGRRGG